MTGRLRTLIRPFAIIRLAVFPLLALLTVLVTGDTARAAGAFNPVNSGTYCAEGSVQLDTNAVTISCTPDISPGSHADVIGTFDIGLGPDGQAGSADDTGDYNFGGVVNLSPTVPSDADIPVGAILGALGSQPTLGLVNNTCSNSQLKVPFTFLKASTDINDTVDMLPFGIGNEMAVISGDNPPFSGQADVKPPPAVTKYPSFLNAIFDPNWVDYGADKIPGNADDTYNGAKAPIKPVFRAAGATSIGAAGNLWVLLQLVVFDRGTKLPNFPALSPAYGYPSVVVLQTSSASGSATPPAPSAVTDFCSPLKTANVSYGTSQDNPDTPANEGGVAVRTLPPPGYQIFSYAYGSSQRDADGDGFENSLDPCPLNAEPPHVEGDVNSGWDARDRTRPIEGDTDKFAGADAPDGIPNSCDPTPNEATAGDPANQPTDHDGDGFVNSGDNCPLVANGVDTGHKDTDKLDGEEVGDGIGDACDPNPGTPDGAEIKCIKESKAIVGGDPSVAFSGCLTELPPVPDADNDGIRDENDTCPNTPAGATVDILGCSPTQEKTVELGSVNTNTNTGGNTAAGGGVGGPDSGIGSLSPVAGTVPAWAAVAAGLGAAGLIGSLGTLASRVVKRRRDL